MSHTAFWPKENFYYPIGNTPPVCLTDHLPPEVDAKILLLGCGDPRNILYTVNVDHGIPRNILLFTFITDNITANWLTQYWAIFYDLFFDKQTALLLNDQCLKLVDYATDMAAWNSSSYGRFLRFTTQDSLNEVRRYWSSYAETLSLSDSEQNQLKQMFRSQMEEKATKGSDLECVYAAAPACILFPSESFGTHTQYWETGVTTPNSDPHPTTQINPTFLFSMAGRKFNLHYGTDLCSSFHFALALTKARTPYTVLHTNSLLLYEYHPTKRSAIEKRALLDFPLLALLLGITPICHSSGLTFRNGSENAGFAMMFKGRLYERIFWRFSDFTHGKWDGTLTEQKHELRFAPAELANKLFALYLNMFDNENVDSLRNKIETKDIGLITIQNPHYHRETFARFLRLIRAGHHVEVDWSQTLDHFVDRVTRSDSLYFGSNNFQNLFVDLHLLGVRSENPLTPGFVVDRYGPKPAPFQTWDLIPSFVCVALKVPRSALKVLEDEAGNPILECETFYKFHNTHSSIRPIFGDIIDAPGTRGQKIIVEDQREPRNLQVGLCIKTTPMDSVLFYSKLGSHLRLFSAKISNRDHVFILRERPDNAGELQRVATMNTLPTRVSGTPTLGTTGVSLDSEAGSISLSKRLNITAAAAKGALVNKSPVETKQTAPCCIEISIGEHRYSLFYPIPVDGTRSKTRIARKSSYVEVEAPSRSSPLTQRTLQPFPMTLDVSKNGTRTTCWNAPYINLDAYPILPFLGDIKWVNIHLGFSLSHDERRRQYTAHAETWEPLMNFKISIANIFIQLASNQVGTYLLQDPTMERPRPYALLFLSSIRLDLSSATIIGDAAIIIPTSPPMMNMLSRHLHGSPSAIINTYGEEVRLWKHALPIFAERCRQWQHLPTCEYQKYERVPLSMEYNDSPLCSCGKGRDLGPFLKNDRWKELAPHATRIAVSLVFPVAYLENVTEGSFETMLSGAFPDPDSGPGGFPGAAGRQTPRCSRCGSTGKPKLLQCGACQVVKYCSKDCQKADWKTHKHICKTLGKRST
ncbi:hypothetical protein P691DRAFT_781245 [Macrolepiota fuliginosa MF-IS2]|uniref:MYND-type domain-containing protein n=1 Tax=Macrolepiota fuliginosa MF-IS2 TaxID=1400762 RepID=A0A9P6C4F9_9AGAR|nr:hypothetical protein P691DRAFT_781245 [Macrolepiota fuliginosa MF-IS2]